MLGIGIGLLTVITAGVLILKKKGIMITQLAIFQRIRKNKSPNKSFSQSSVQKQATELQDNAAPQELKDYIVQSRAAKIPDTVIRGNLLKVGWSEEMISKAFKSFQK